MTQFANAVCAAEGFTAAGIHVGVKTSNKTKKDIAMIASDVPCSVAAMFTTNVVKAAPVKYNMGVLPYGKVQGIIVNSGNANACTGQQGMDDAAAMAKMTGDLLGVSEKMVMVCSTGVIGQRMPMKRIAKGIAEVHGALSREGGHDAAEAILTTDVFFKEYAVTVALGTTAVTIGGMAKGSGMICPNMATMLSFITSDAVIDSSVLQDALNEAVVGTFNQISVDGDMSTNDTVICLANGMAGNTPIQKGSADYDDFVTGLTKVCHYLAKKVARDGEGATHLVEAEVRGGKSLEDARKIAKSIVSSNLTKAAIFGKDANWGRILCAAGYSGVDFDPEKADISLVSENGTILVAKNGGGLEFNESTAADILKAENITILVELQEGSFTGYAWGCDLTYDYVKINADYRT